MFSNTNKPLAQTLEPKELDVQYWDKICKLIGYISVLLTVVIIVFLILSYSIEDK